MQHAPDPSSMATLYVHVRILLGMIVGLGLTHLLRNLAKIVERPKARRVYWVHLAWALFMFIYLLHFWWWEFRLAHQAHWDFNLYFFVTLYALLLYLLCALIFPESVDDYQDYRDYFYTRRHWFFGLLAVMFVVDLGDTAIKGAGYLHQLGGEYWFRNAAYVVACIGAIATRRPAYHGSFAVAALLYELSWIVRRYEVLA
ncbi:hypothetical protein [Pseudoxanthomonas wuyuanensis]|uniref:Transmembrane protein n=1 Tax=Pseudoxanthomonas wuyuanensis TaxID=1073196 RepID=A0A286CXH0_9GAMM|nr:hypothetical protein [Pseudoxanthomonas wuyuanensis]SOD51074.1 hypothetical protein SAMN06296416_101440 [Pseudoxanthomonas wuyuanensis]